jgi:hypothetical protein
VLAFQDLAYAELLEHEREEYHMEAQEDQRKSAGRPSFPEAHQQRCLLPEYAAVYLDTSITNLIADFRDTSWSFFLVRRASGSGRRGSCTPRL